MNFRKDQEQRVHIQGKVDVKALAELLRYFRSLGHSPTSRSELLAMVIEGWAKLLRMNGRTNAVKSAREAFSILSAHGLEWDSERGKKERLNIIAHEEKDIVHSDELLVNEREQRTRKEIEERARRNMESLDFFKDIDKQEKIDSREDMTKEELEAKAHAKEEEDSQRLRSMIEHMKKSPTIVSDKDKTKKNEKKQ